MGDIQNQSATLKGRHKPINDSGGQMLRKLTRKRFERTECLICEHLHVNYFHSLLPRRSCRNFQFETKH